MKKILVSLLIFIALSLLGCIILYNYNLSAVNNDSTEIEFEVKEGSNFYSIAPLLKEKGLIKSEFCYKLYIKFNVKDGLKTGVYSLRSNMSVKELVKALNNSKKNIFSVTFKEGKNMRNIASIIAENTNSSEEDFYNLLNDKNYLDELKNNYWFITDDIMNQNIYYSLEGYLYPNTYSFSSKNVSSKDLVKAMLDEMNRKLDEYKNEIQNNKFSIHEILTLASIVELEASTSEDRAMVAQVFINRLNSNMALGSDVTTYYASKVDMSERDLTTAELNDRNYYNTRSTFLAGKLPVGPICNPSIDSIKAVLYPTKNYYYYFVSDKNKKIYFSKTNSENLNKKQELIEAGLWYTY